MFQITIEEKCRQKVGESMPKRRLIPFRFMPGSWGLKGKTFDRAKAEYELDGDDLVIRLAEIEHGSESTEVATAKVVASFNKKEIDEYTKELKLAEMIKDEDTRKKEVLNLQFKHHKINESEYNRDLATLNKEPWVSVVKVELKKDNPNSVGELELDWNEYFVQDLKKNGYTGPSDYVIVEKWFNLLCSAIAAENGIVDGTDRNSAGVPGLNDEGTAGPGDGRREYF